MHECNYYISNKSKTTQYKRYSWYVKCKAQFTLYKTRKSGFPMTHDETI